MKFDLKIKILENGKNLPFPKYETKASAGIDLRAANYEDLKIAPSRTAIIPIGIAISLEAGLEAQIRPRSGLAAKYAITVLNSPGTIDADYRGEIKVILINHSKEDFIVKRGDRIAQMVINQIHQCKLTQLDNLDETQRGEGGFGSTGRN